MRIRSIGVVVALTLAGLACDRSPAPVASVLNDDAITVASFSFPESEVLAEIYATALEGGRYRVERMLNVGTRELVLPALQRGLVELVPEYSGSALEFLGGSPTASRELTHRALVDVMAGRGIAVLAPARAQDRNALAVTVETAGRFALRRVSDLVPFARTMTLAGPPECPQRSFCLPGFERTYGLRFDRFLPVDLGGAVTAEALVQGAVDVGVLFTTEPALLGRTLVLLRDDAELQPAEHVTPVVRREVLDHHGPGVAEILDRVSANLTTEDLRRLNALVGDGQEPAVAARQWLSSHGFDEAGR